MRAFAFSFLLACGYPVDPPGSGLPPPVHEYLSYDQGVTGDLYYDPPGPKILFVLIAPIGYDRGLWLTEFGGGVSTAKILLNANYAIALLDLPEPSDGKTATLASHSSALHQAIASLKKNYPRTVCLGSTGSAVVLLRTQSDFGDCSALIIQSWTPVAHNPGIGQVDWDNFGNPAYADTKGYVTTPKGIRDKGYGSPISEDAVDADRSYLNVRVPVAYAGAWLQTFNTPAEVRLPALIPVPILVQYGLADKGLAPYMQWPVSVTIKTYPTLGTIFDLHPSATAARTDILVWLMAVRWP